MAYFASILIKYVSHLLPLTRAEISLRNLLQFQATPPDKMESERLRKVLIFMEVEKETEGDAIQLNIINLIQYYN